VGKIQRSLRIRSSSGNIACCLKTSTDVVTLSFDAKIDGFPGLIVEHLCAKFGDRSCIDC